MKYKWSRSEARTVRPFRNSEHLLEKTAIRIFSDDNFSQEEIILKDSLELEKLNIEFKFDFDLQSVYEVLGIADGLLRLIISIEDKLLKKRFVALNLSLSECSADIIPISKNITKYLSWLGDTLFVVAFVLEKDRPLEIGSAYMSGHWLTKKEFKVTKNKGDVSALPTINISPEMFRDRYGLPIDTAYYVDVADGDLNLPLDQLSENVGIYINENIALVLSRAEVNSSGRALISSIGCDIAATILSAGFNGITSIDELDTKGVLYMVAERLSRGLGVEIKTVMQWAQEPGSARLRSLIQSNFDLAKTIASITFRGKS